MFIAKNNFCKLLNLFLFAVGAFLQTHELSSLDRALSVANDVGYPVLIKAVSGGGGKGMCVCAFVDPIKTLMNNFGG